jgi:tape measure domain-containing protein
MANNLEYILRLKDQFSKTMQGAANQTKGLDGKMGGLKNKMGGLGKAVGSLGGMIAGAFAVGSIVSFGKAVIESLKNYEYFHASLKTLLNGNQNATKALENQLVTLAKTTPFELTEIQAATKQLMAYGFKAGDVVDTIRTLGDVSSGVGAPLGDIAYLYGTLKTSGRVTLMDLRQFAGRGIPIYETLAKRLNTTTDAINGMASNGKIAFKDIEGAFKDMTKEGGQFFKLMEDQSKTVGGKISNMGDSWEQLKVNIGKSQTGIISSTVSFFSTMLESLSNYFAQSNQLEEIAMKYNVKGASWWDKLTMGKITEYQARVNKNVSGEGDMKVKQQLLYDKTTELKRQSDLGKIDAEEYKTKLFIIQEGLETLKGIKDINSMKQSTSQIEGAKTGGVDGGKGTKSLGTGSEVSGQRPQAINISIDKLVNELNIQTTNLTEGAGRMKELVSKALLEAVNDINLIAMA